MTEIPARLRDAVIARARNRCEYCQLSQDGQEAVFHIDHVQPRNCGGPTVLDNLALACVSCSLRKWARVSSVDPESELLATLFDPRMQQWRDHFEWNGDAVIPKTPTGRATVDALAMNRPIIRSIRQEEMIRDRHPPKDS
jgi:hypothetical protein